MLEEIASKDIAIEIEARNIDDRTCQNEPVAVLLSEPVKETEVRARCSLFSEFWLQYQINK